MNCGFAFEHEISKGKDLGIHLTKISTPRFGRSIYDFFGVYLGIPIALECKATRTATCFAFNRVEDHQVTALLDMHSNGGKAYILINIRQGKSQEAYALSILEYNRLREVYGTINRKSIPLEVIRKLPKLVKVSGAWDIRPLFTKEVYNETTAITDATATSKRPRTKTDINEGIKSKNTGSK